MRGQARERAQAVADVDAEAQLDEAGVASVQSHHPVFGLGDAPGRPMAELLPKSTSSRERRAGPGA